MRKLSALVVASFVIANPVASNLAAYAETQTAYNATLGDEVYGATTFSQAPPIEGDGALQVTDPRALEALGYDPSRTWRDGEAAADVLQVGDIKNIYRFTDFTTRQIADYTGIDLTRHPLVGVYGAQSLEKLVQENPQVGKVAVRSLPAIEALLTGQYDQSVQAGLQTASQYFDELDAFLKENPQFKNFPVTSLAKGDWQGLIPVAQQTAFKELSERLPEHLQDLPVRSLPAIAALSKGNYDSAVETGLQIASEHFEALDTFLRNNPQFGRFPIEALSKGEWEAVLPIAQQTAIKEIAKRLPEEFQGVPAASLSAISDLSDGNYDRAVTKGLEIASEHFSELEEFLKDNPQFKNFPIEALAKGDLNGVLPFAQQTAVKEIARHLPEHLQDVPVAAVPAVTALAKGNFRAAVPATIDTLEALDNPTINQFLENHPYAKDLVLGLVGQRFSVENIPGLADQAVRTLEGIDQANIAEIPGLDQVPLELTAAIPNIAALLQGDLFGRFDFAWGDEDKAYNVITGSTRGRKFQPEPCQVGVTPDTKSCSGIELQDGDGSLNGRFIVLGPNQKVKGGSGFLKKINNGKEQTGWQPWGPKAIDDGSLKLVAKSVSEGGGGEAASAEFELRLAFCIKKLFVNLGCTPHFIPFPFLLHPKVSQDGDILLATNSPAPNIPSSVLKQYRRKHGYGDETYCAAAPSSGGNEPNDGSYQEATELVEVGNYHGRTESLEPQTAEAFQTMQEAAAKDGVNLEIGSGFRSVADQQGIWDDKRARGLSDEAISKVNTQPGFSEHHTGRAVDIVDPNRPETDFNNEFGNSNAGRWLNENAEDYGFEKSYPLEDNNGIQREEWHWRYVGTPEARQALNLESASQVTSTGAGDAALSSVDIPEQGVSPDALREAIIGKESGYDYQAVNPDSGALGFGQVMPENVASWTQAAVGRAMTPNEFLNDPEVQIQTINHRLSLNLESELNATGGDSELSIRRVASIWYSGRAHLYDDPTPQYYNGRRYPSIQEYTLDVLDRYQQNPSGTRVVASRSICVASANTGAGSAGGGGATGGASQTVEGNGIATGKFVNPAPTRSVRSDYFTLSHPERGGDPHKGVDIASFGQENVPILAADGGYVEYIGYDGGGWGRYVIVDHRNGYATLYAHLDSVQVQEGQKLSQSQELGRMGNTGRSTGVHLHFEVIKDYQSGNRFSGYEVDPENYIQIPR